MDHTKYWLAFQKTGVGYQTLRKLLKHFANIEDAWQASESQLRATEISPGFVLKFIYQRGQTYPDKLLEATAKEGLHLLTVDNEQYPFLLREIHSPPLVLFVRGSIDCLSAKCLTVVGTRQPTAYGRQATHTIVEPLARDGSSIVSGLAYGIDTEAHKAALASGGRTIAVLGGGVDVVFPRGNTGLAERILAQSGTLISEYPPGTEPQKHFFPQRNRIMAGLSRATVIVEAGEKSGALITARLALDENREVFAVPGPITSDVSFGPNTLLSQGATVVQSAQDLRESLGLDIYTTVPKNKQIRADTPTEEKLLVLLTEPRHVDELVTISHLSASDVNATLSMLEMKKRIRHLGGMHYVRN